MELDNAYVETLRKIAEAASLHRPPSAQDEPVTRLRAWTVYTVELPATKDNTIHFVGRTGNEGRVSSAIQSYDSTTKEGTSRSGRIYKLIGPAGFDPDAEYVWRAWTEINHVLGAANISDQYE